MTKKQRRQSDHWTKKAKKSGFQARSVYKLEEMDKKFGVLKGKHRVLDLGCSPGSWSQYVYRKLKSVQLMGIDIQPTPSYIGHFVQMSIEDLTAEDVTAYLNALPDLIISDMAPSTIGQKQTDHLRQIALAEMALDLVERVLTPGGTFVVKVFEIPTITLDSPFIACDRKFVTWMQT